MTSISKLMHNTQIYLTLKSDFYPAPGLQSTTKEFVKHYDIYKNKYEIQMASPYYTTEKPDNHEIVAKIYTMERMLLSFIGAHGTFYRNDDRAKTVGTITGVPYVPAVLSDESFANEVANITPPERLFDYTDDFVDNFITYLESHKRWAIDYPSYRWLHNKLSAIAGSFHGIGAKGCSPNKKHLNRFVSRYFRGSLTTELLKRYQNLKRLKTSIENHIALQKFNVLEIMGCHIG